MLVKSFTPHVNSSDWVHAANLLYSSKRLSVGWQHEYVGHNYNAEVGYVPRKGYIKMNPYFSYLFFPRKGAILSHGIGFNSTYYFDEHWKNIDYRTILPYTIAFRNGASFVGLLQKDYVYLTGPFDPTNSGKDTLARGTEHRANTIGFDYFSSPKKKFTFSFNTRVGGYYADGDRLSIGGDATYRFQPYAVISLALTYTDLRMPAPWNRTELWIVSPRIDITFTNNFYFTTFFQFNNQTKNININTRLQWRYRPASDIFLVFTDNYYPDPFGVKNRALVLKATYWWNK